MYNVCTLVSSCVLMQVMLSLSTVAFAQVDWHDFVVVETVDFKDSETGWYGLVTV